METPEMKIERLENSLSEMSKKLKETELDKRYWYDRYNELASKRNALVMALKGLLGLTDEVNVDIFNSK